VSHGPTFITHWPARGKQRRGDTGREKGIGE
jgi:hypothetical protein